MKKTVTPVNYDKLNALLNGKGTPAYRKASDVAGVLVLPSYVMVCLPGETPRSKAREIGLDPALENEFFVCVEMRFNGLTYSQYIPVVEWRYTTPNADALPDWFEATDAKYRVYQALAEVYHEYIPANITRTNTAMPV